MRGVDHNIWRINADGSSRLQLTQDGTSDNPDWVPGGSQICFRSTRDQKAISTAEGARHAQPDLPHGIRTAATQTRLSDGTTDDKFPDVTAERRPHRLPAQPQLARRQRRPGARHRDRQHAAGRHATTGAGSQVTELRTRIDRYPARISRDGSKIVVIRQAAGKSSQVQVLDVATDQFSTLSARHRPRRRRGHGRVSLAALRPAGHIVVLRRAYTFGPLDSA